MEFGVLGPVEVVAGSEPLHLSGAKQRCLLAIFLSRPGQVISNDQLIDDLWDGNPPDSASTALRVHVTNLRGVLEPGRSRSSPSVRLPATPPGYRLMLEPDELDAQRFERMLVRAKDTSRAAPSATVAILQEALDLWRGAPFADVHDLSCLQGEVARLEELRASAFEELMEALLADGKHAVLVSQLEMGVDEYPLRERLTGQLMLALYRAGRQAEALRAYSQLRMRLGDELGIDPSRALQLLEEAILLQKPELEWRSPRLPPVAVPTRAGEELSARSEEFARLQTSFASAVARKHTSVFLSGAAGIDSPDGQPASSTKSRLRWGWS